MIPAGVQVYVASTPVNFRKGAIGLMALVRWWGRPIQRRAVRVPFEKSPTRDILHTVFEVRQLHIHGIPFLDERFKSHRSDAARI